MKEEDINKLVDWNEDITVIAGPHTYTFTPRSRPSIHSSPEEKIALLTAQVERLQNTVKLRDCRVKALEATISMYEDAAKDAVSQLIHHLDLDL